jgi:hypothetical protein
MAENTAYNIRLRSDTRQNWLEQNPILAKGEMAIEFQTDSTKVKIKVGNGVDKYGDLPYFNNPISYNDVEDKPSLNGFEIDGERTLADYGIQPLGSYVTSEMNEELLELKCDKDDTYSKAEVDSLFEGLLKLPAIGNNTNKFLKIDSNGVLYWSTFSEDVYTKDEVNNLLEERVLKEDGQTLISEDEKYRLANVYNYDDTSVKNDLAELKADVLKKAYSDALDDYLTKDEFSESMEGYAVRSELASKANADELYNHINSQINPHKVTKKQVGLANVDDTADIDKPISTATQAALNKKQNAMKIGFGLQLSSGVLQNTNPNVNADWEATDGDAYILNKPTFAPVAFSNSYKDLSDLPYIPSEYYLQGATEDDLGGIKLSSDVYLNDDQQLCVNYKDDMYDYLALNNRPSLIVTDDNNVEQEYVFIPGMTKKDLDIAGYDETQSALNLKYDKTETYNQQEIDDKLKQLQIGAVSWGLIQGNISSQYDLKYALDQKADVKSISSVGSSNSYNDLDDKPYIPEKTSDLTNDSDFSTNADVVHKTGNETVEGVKTFTSLVRGSANANQFNINHPTDVSGTTPSTTQYYQYGISDKNGRWLGGFEHTHNSNGSVYKGVYVRHPTDDSTWSNLTVGFDANGVAYSSAPTPSSATDNSTHIATTSWVNNTSNTVVHKSGTEAISGVKVFKQGCAIIQNNATDTYRELRVLNRNLAYANGDIPSLSWYGGCSTRDKNNVEISTVATSVEPDGSNNAFLHVRQPISGSSNTNSIGIRYPVSGDAYTWAPTPATSDVSSKIATTSFVNSRIMSIMDSYTSTKGSKYVKINGLIMQWGTVSIYTNNKTRPWYTFTYPVAFSNTDYTLLTAPMGGSYSTAPGYTDDLSITIQQMTTTSASVMPYDCGTNYYTTLVQWMAIGY